MFFVKYQPFLFIIHHIKRVWGLLNKTCNFGFATPENLEYETIRKAWIECDRLGFDSAWITDHLAKDFFLESWTTLSALAIEVNNLRFGPMVLCNSFRHPPVVAKMAATLDIISGGRLELGMGAGWHEEEHVSYGISFPETLVRIQKLKEAVTIIKKMWLGKTSYSGKYYNVQNASTDPKPRQKPHPLIWIGGYGEKLLLRVVAEVADGYILRMGATPEEYEHKMNVLEGHCQKVGRKISNIRKAWVGPAIIGKNNEEVRRKIQSHKATFTSTKPFEHYLEESLVGTPEECLDKVRKYLDVGVTDIIMTFSKDDAENLEAFKLLSDGVISVIRGK